MYGRNERSSLEITYHNLWEHILPREHVLKSLGGENQGTDAMKCIGFRFSQRELSDGAVLKNKSTKKRGYTRKCA